MQFTVRASLRPATGDLGKDRSVALDEWNVDSNTEASCFGKIRMMQIDFYTTGQTIHDVCGAARCPP
jgi:hypothetical protein